jgi:transposase
MTHLLRGNRPLARCPNQPCCGGLERRLGAILATPTTCDLAAALQAKLRRARDQLLIFAAWPGQVEATNNACERHLRPAVIQRKVTNGYRATWAAEGGAAEGSARGSAWKGSGGEADIRTVVDTARLKPGTSVLHHPANHHSLTATPSRIPSFSLTRV